jgi:predicted Zn-dependent protease
MFRGGDLKNALPVIDSLIKDVPQDPYFWELKGQALVEGGRAAQAIAPLKEANRILPNNGLLKLLYAQALLGSESAGDAKTAIALLKDARRTEGDTPQTYSLMAMGYGILNDVPRAELATAEAAVAQGDKDLALEKAKNAAALFKQGTPEWLRANDILNMASRK